MKTAFVRIVEEMLAENSAAAERGYGSPVGYLGTVIDDAPGLVRRLSEHWHDLEMEARRLHELLSSRHPDKKADLIDQRIVIEHLLLAASRVAPIVNAALADQYVNLIEEPHVLSGMAKSYHNGQQWLERVVTELETLEEQASRSVTSIGRWQILFRAALLCQMIAGECLNLLAENVAADLAAG